jgi:hypothetical protein
MRFRVVGPYFSCSALAELVSAATFDRGQRLASVVDVGDDDLPCAAQTHGPMPCTAPVTTTTCSLSGVDEFMASAFRDRATAIQKLAMSKGPGERDGLVFGHTA